MLGIKLNSHLKQIKEKIDFQINDILRKALSGLHNNIKMVINQRVRGSLSSEEEILQYMKIINNTNSLEYLLNKKLLENYSQCYITIKKCINNIENHIEVDIEKYILNNKDLAKTIFSEDKNKNILNFQILKAESMSNEYRKLTKMITEEIQSINKDILNLYSLENKLTDREFKSKGLEIIDKLVIITEKI